MKHIYYLLLTTLILSSFSISCNRKKCGDDAPSIKINEIQTIGSHNSYRIRTYQPLFDYVLGLAQTGLIPASYNPNEWDYDHVTIDEQLATYNVRSLELDIFHDPQGGRFYNHQAKAFLDPPEATEGDPALLEPGIKIIHIPDADYLTHNISLVDALQTVKTWSDANPNHIPVTIMLELKRQTIGDELPGLGFATALPFSTSALDSLDMEIKSVFGDKLSNVIVPDEIRDDYSNLNEAIKAGNWPSLYKSRGKVMFVLMASEEYKQNYLEGHPSLENRVCFVFGDPDDPETAFIILNDAIGSQTEIQTRVSEGYIVRTRADANTTEARTGDYTRMNAALNSGAQLISTDYYRPDPRQDTSSAWTDYVVQLPGNVPAQNNVINAPNKSIIDYPCLEN
ncbi:MAG: phosphatidylinositol-specific phospholipase C1-like protein [Saprospiraceae bacterium]|nr:phosphatidylinositol-specific phospholipase C1-like protein [Saprospiraceae bacterium]